LLNRTAAQHHAFPGPDPRFVVCGIEIPGFGRVEKRHIQVLGAYGELNFRRSELLAGELGLDLGRLVDHLWGDGLERHAERRKNICKAINNLSPDHMFRQFMKEPNDLYICPNTTNIIDKLKEDGGLESLQAALYLKDVPVCRASEMKKRFPTAFEEVVKPLLGSAQEFIKPLTPMHEPQLARRFEETLGPLKRAADKVCGWGAFLPCSLESYQFMVAHHRGLFERLAGSNDRNIDEYGDAYNEAGLANAKGTLAALETNSAFTFLHVMERRIVRQIARGEGDFRFAGEADRASLHEHLLTLAARFNKRVKIAVIGHGEQKLLEDRHPGIESTWFLVQQHTAVAAVDRKLNGMIVITKTPRKVQEKLDRMMGTVLFADQLLDMAEFSNLLKSDEGAR